MLLSDGNENIGDALAAVIAARPLGVTVDVVPLGVARGGDVSVQKLSLPANIKKGQTFEVKIFAQADQAQRATVRLFRNDHLLGEQPVQLEAGKNLFTFPQTLTEPDFYKYEVQIEAPGDTVPQNNDILIFDNSGQIYSGFVAAANGFNPNNDLTNLDQITSKLLYMQQTMDQIVDDLNWQDDGTLNLPMSKRSASGVPLSNSGLVSERNGKPVLTMRWLSKGDTYALGYLLSAVCVAHKNASDGHKAEKFLEEGLRLLRTNLKPTEAIALPVPNEKEFESFLTIFLIAYLD